MRILKAVWPRDGNLVSSTLCVPWQLKPCDCIWGHHSLFPDPPNHIFVFVGSFAWSQVWSPESLLKDFNSRTLLGDAPKVSPLLSLFMEQQDTDSYPGVSVAQGALCTHIFALKVLPHQPTSLFWRSFPISLPRPSAPGRHTPVSKCSWSPCEHCLQWRLSLAKESHMATPRAHEGRDYTIGWRSRNAVYGGHLSNHQPHGTWSWAT